MIRTRGRRPKAREMAKAASIEPVASCFDRLEMAPDLFQLSMGGPRTGWRKSQLCSRSDDLEKQKAASSRNGTVGMIGRTMPINPNPRATIPPAVQIQRMTLPLGQFGDHGVQHHPAIWGGA